MISHTDIPVFGVAQSESTPQLKKCCGQNANRRPKNLKELTKFKKEVKEEKNPGTSVTVWFTTTGGFCLRSVVQKQIQPDTKFNAVLHHECSL